VGTCARGARESGTSSHPGAQGLLFNPFVFSSALKRAGRLRYELEFEDDTPMASLVVALERCVQKTRLVLPLEGRVMVLDGYDILSHHRRWNWIGPARKGVRRRRQLRAIRHRPRGDRREGVDVQGRGQAQ
jgi:hypothetical protein